MCQLSVEAVKGFLKVNKIDIQLPLPFSALFNDAAQCEDLSVHPCSFLKPACSFLMPELTASEIRLMIRGKDLAWYREQCNATPVGAVAECAFLWCPDDDSLCPVSWHFPSLPYSCKKWLKMVAASSGSALKSSAWSCHVLELYNP